MPDFKNEYDPALPHDAIAPDAQVEWQATYDEDLEPSVWDSPPIFTTCLAIFVGIVASCLLTLVRDITSPTGGESPRLSEEIRSFISLSCMQPVVTLWVLTSFSVRHGATLPYKVTLAILNCIVVFMVAKALLP
ncbi:hypothetical protein CC2G_006581 [Coprinopsis cinerea AmutBmut pab1-1]|nr:hypothetical protein CC2G_006581 [Coprinopsis cinerea AmutBmut pab1-1]